MINFNIIEKNSKPGPRYTSYPTALEFTDDFNYNNYIHYLSDPNNKRPLSLYFHFPFCQTACYFCGCNVIYTANESKKTRYVEYLIKEIEMFSNILPQDRIISQLHFGGGTPTYHKASEISIVLKAIKKYLPEFDKNAEISFEADPRHLNEHQIRILTEFGFNRLSLGVQDFNPKVQKSVNRLQSKELTENCIQLARNYGIKSINLDLIYGLPFQTVDSFLETLETTVNINPDRIAIFNYAHVPWVKKIMNRIKTETLPTPKEKLELLKMSINYLTKNNYKMIGMDHFAKVDDELYQAIQKKELHRNFQGYTTKAGTDLIGIGLTSIGQGQWHYAQNYKDLQSYEEAIMNNKLPLAKGLTLSDDDKIRQYVIMELMSNFCLFFEKFDEKFPHIQFFDYFAFNIKELAPFIQDALVNIDDEAIRVSDTGVLLIRNIAMVFDAYTATMKKEKTFSNTI